ncbi:prealbumin-like fold domain-containing protein [Massilicoli timonensis]|uniref:prealbumin-like fold domain-containing protein n=1 Tax=Massilicoli timonensis TaxID=2015901 RepID=UPI0011AF7A28|nr:prealbumin-like fold domain-containing protein [Massilicoli timonensis]
MQGLFPKYTPLSQPGRPPDFNANIDASIQIGDGYATINEAPLSLYFEDGQFVTTNFDLYENLSKTNAEIDRTQINTDHLYILNHIKSTGFGFGGFSQVNASTGGVLQVNWQKAIISNVTPNSKSREWLLPIATQIISKVEKGTLQSDFSIDFTKTSAKTNQVLPGATYGLYRDGTDELIGSYTTDDDGAFSIPNDKLQGEKFYLKEITAPVGHQLNPEKIPLTLKNGSIALASKTGSKVTENTGSTTQEHDLGDNGVFAIGGGMLTMPDPNNPGQSITVDPAGLDLQIILPEVNGQKGTLKSLTVTRTKGNNTTITEQGMEETFTGSVEEVEEAALEFINKAVKGGHGIRSCGGFR